MENRVRRRSECLTQETQSTNVKHRKRSEKDDTEQDTDDTSRQLNKTNEANETALQLLALYIVKQVNCVVNIEHAVQFFSCNSFVAGCAHIQTDTYERKKTHIHFQKQYTDTTRTYTHRQTRCKSHSTSLTFLRSASGIKH